MPSVRVFVDSQEIMDELDVEELCEELITRKGWQAALEKTIKGEAFNFSEKDHVSLRDVCEAMRNRKPYENLLRDLAYDQFGFVI